MPERGRGQRLRPVPRRSPRWLRRLTSEPTEVRAAAYSGVAVVTAGLLGGLVAVLGTVYVTHVQVDAEAERSSTEFLRTQEQEPYAAFLASHETLLSHEQRVNPSRPRRRCSRPTRASSDRSRTG